MTQDDLVTGPAAAAILATGAGSLVFGILSLATDASPRLDAAFSLYLPSGSLSGVSAASVIIWLICWVLLGRRWGRRDIGLFPVTAAAFAMLLGGMLLSFPPFMDFVQGK